MIHNFKKVTKDLYRGSAPSPIDVVYLKEKYNIKKIVSLDKASADKIHKATQLLGIKHIVLPIDFKNSSLLKALNVDLKELLLEGGPTYIHCLHGKDRTGLIIALLQCKYFGKSPDEAIKEAKEFGFGIGVNPKVTHLYEKIIHSCKPEKDINNADIVELERDYMGDSRDSYLDRAKQQSFCPFLSPVRQYPNDNVYNFINDQSPTRENYEEYRSIKEHSKEKDVIPLVGLYNNETSKGFGPVDMGGGFIYD
jgi:hypothetical protein